jgi:hypothetical protein
MGTNKPLVVRNAPTMVGFDEIGHAYGVGRKTVRGWIKSGAPVERNELGMPVSVHEELWPWLKGYWAKRAED